MMYECTKTRSELGGSIDAPQPSAWQICLVGAELLTHAVQVCRHREGLCCGTSRETRTDKDAGARANRAQMALQ